MFVSIDKISLHRGIVKPNSDMTSFNGECELHCLAIHSKKKLDLSSSLLPTPSPEENQYPPTGMCNSGSIQNVLANTKRPSSPKLNMP
jgi:hypothetical protein